MIALALIVAVVVCLAWRSHRRARAYEANCAVLQAQLAPIFAASDRVSEQYLIQRYAHATAEANARGDTAEAERVYAEFRAELRKGIHV